MQTFYKQKEQLRLMENVINEGMGEQIHTPSFDIDAMQTPATLCVFSETENFISALQVYKAISEKEAHLSGMIHAQRILKIVSLFVAER